jgi:hypothetical protein
VRNLFLKKTKKQIPQTFAPEEVPLGDGLGMTGHFEIIY